MGKRNEIVALFFRTQTEPENNLFLGVRRSDIVKMCKSIDILLSILL